MTDPDQETAEALDEDQLADEFPPEVPLAADDMGVTGLEQLGGESVADRDARTEPEVWTRTPRPDERAPTLQGDAEPGAVDDEKDLVAPPVPQDDRLDPDGSPSSPESDRGFAAERAPDAAEEAAVRLDDEAPGATG
jgi:hypothetical protein